MYNLLARKGQLFAFILGAAITVIFLLVVLGNLPETFNTMTKEARHEVNVFNFGISASILLIILAAAGMLIFGIYQVITNFRASLKGLIGLGVLFVIFFIARASSSGLCDDPTVSETVCKTVGGGITVALVLIAIAFVGFLVSELISLIK